MFVLNVVLKEIAGKERNYHTHIQYSVKTDAFMMFQFIISIYITLILNQE